jgi:ABC-type enterochelin transport system substrate-binding protein
MKHTKTLDRSQKTSSAACMNVRDSSQANSNVERDHVKVIWLDVHAYELVSRNGLSAVYKSPKRQFMMWIRCLKLK